MRYCISVPNNTGGPTPFFPMGKLCLFPWQKMGEKGIWKERESIRFPFFPYTFFPWEKMGLEPPPPIQQ